MKRCRKGRWVIRYGQTAEIYSKEKGNLLASFRAVSDMCEETLNAYLVFRHDISEDYKIRIIRESKR